MTVSNEQECEGETLITSKAYARRCSRRRIHGHVLVAEGLRDGHRPRVALCRDRWRRGQARSVGEGEARRSCPQGMDGEQVGRSRQQVVEDHEHVEESDRRKGHHRGGRSSHVGVDYDGGNRHGEGCSREEVHGGSSRPRQEVVHGRNRHHHDEVGESVSGSDHEVGACEGFRSECRKRNGRWHS